MRISIRVKPNARKNDVRKIDDKRFIVSVSAPPFEGKANDQVIELLSEYFGKAKRNITIVRGATAREKIVEVL